MKKLFSMMLVIMLAFAFPVQVSAEESPTMESIANSIIEITTDNSNENPTTTYNNIEEFVNEVHDQIPDIDDLELANFIMDYTGQEELEVADEEALKYLGFKEIIVSEDYIKVDEMGNAESMTQDEMTLAMFRDDYGISPLQNPWTSDNGYMKIKTVISRESGIVNGYVDYQIGAFGHWLKMPTCYFTDVFAIHFNNAVFDSSHEIYGKLEEKASCCGTAKKYKSQVWNNEDKPPYYTEKNVVVSNQFDNAVAIKFKLIQPQVFQCNSITQNHSSVVSDILTYMSYGISVLPGTKFTTQAGYCHKQVSIGSIGVSASAGGISFSLSGIGSKKEYIADKVTTTVYK